MFRKMILLVLAIQLSGCAVAFHAANGTLGEVFGMPNKTDVNSFGDGSGFQPALQVQIPADVCDKTAFIDGFKDDYILNWNQFVSSKITQYQGRVYSSKSKDKVATQNLALYKSHLIGTGKGYTGNGMKYVPTNEQVRSGNLCVPNSYTKGRNAAMDEVAKQRQALVSQEL